MRCVVVLVNPRLIDEVIDTFGSSGPILIVFTENLYNIEINAFLCKRDRSDQGAGAKGQGCEELPPVVVSEL
jgi:hypothetical protein